MYLSCWTHISSAIQICHLKIDFKTASTLCWPFHSGSVLITNIEAYTPQTHVNHPAVHVTLPYMLIMAFWKQQYLIRRQVRGKMQIVNRQQGSEIHGVTGCSDRIALLPCLVSSIGIDLCLSRKHHRFTYIRRLILPKVQRENPFFPFRT